MRQGISRQRQLLGAQQQLCALARHKLAKDVTSAPALQSKQASKQCLQRTVVMYRSLSTAAKPQIAMA